MLSALYFLFLAVQDGSAPIIGRHPDGYLPAPTRRVVD